MIFPELLRRIPIAQQTALAMAFSPHPPFLTVHSQGSMGFGNLLPNDSLQYLRATGVFVDEVCHVVYALVDYDVHSLLGRGVGGYFGGRYCLRHLVSRLH